MRSCFFCRLIERTSSLVLAKASAGPSGERWLVQRCWSWSQSKSFDASPPAVALVGKIGAIGTIHAGPWPAPDSRIHACVVAEMRLFLQCFVCAWE
jgi:hypothetical protein